MLGAPASSTVTRHEASAARDASTAAMAERVAVPDSAFGSFRYASCFPRGEWELCVPEDLLTSKGLLLSARRCCRSSWFALESVAAVEVTARGMRKFAEHCEPVRTTRFPRRTQLRSSLCDRATACVSRGSSSGRSASNAASDEDYDAVDA